jgi:hypothetical protein
MYRSIVGSSAKIDLSGKVSANKLNWDTLA